jgi:hypothetical protein
MVYKFRSHTLGLMIWKDGSIVATFVNGYFQTTDLTLASYLIQFEEVICITPFVQEQPNDPPLPVVEEPVVTEVVEEPVVAKVTKKVKK